MRRGDTISAEEVHTKIYCPVRSQQTFMRIMFYCTERRDVQYIDEPDVSALGELSIDIGKAMQVKFEKRAWSKRR